MKRSLIVAPFAFWFVLMGDSVGRTMTRSLRSNRNGLRRDYREKEESDLRADVNETDSDTEDTGGKSDTEPIWLKDEVKDDSDVALDSDEESDERQLNELLRNSQSELQQKADDEDDEDDNLDEVDKQTVSLKLKKLNEFVKQSQVYSGVIADTLLERSMQKQEDQKAQEPPAKKQKKGARSIVDFFKRKGEEKDEQNVSDVMDDKTIADQQPALLKNCVLKGYQLEGLNWLITLYENGLNGILADDMGLGKTIQSIALLAFIYEMDTKGPFLIAAPLSTVDNWMNEFEKFAPDLPVLKYYHQGGYKERSKLLRKFFKNTKGTGVVVTSYEMIIRDSDQIMSKQWKFLIVDEGHRLKNINCKLIQELKRINTTNRLLLTGTPLQNNLGELWSLLNFIMPEIFADFEIFNKWFNFEDLDLQSDSSKLNRVINDELEKNLISNLHTILKPFLLRRLKKTVLAGILPPKREYIIDCPLTPMQNKLYRMGLSGKLKKTIFKELIKHFFTLNSRYIGNVSNKSIRDYINYKLGDQAVDGPPSDILKKMDILYGEHLHKEFTSIKLQNMMMQLRQIVDSTFLFYFPYMQPEDLTLEMLLSTSGKLQVLQKLLPPLIKKGHKVLIFSQFIKMLDLIEDWCELNSLNALRIDGSVDNETRKAQISQFNSPKDQTNVFLLSTRAAGLGINLAVADTVVLFDSDWNPQVDLQAMDRCHRIGQVRPVIVYRLCCDNTVEHIILTRAASKRRLEKLVIQMGQFNTLRKLALNEKSFLQQSSTNTHGSRATNKELFQELSQLLLSGESSIGFNRNRKNKDQDNGQLTSQELAELTDRSAKAYEANRTVELPHVRLFETSTGQL